MLTHRRNASDLQWYFSEGLSSFERSTFGGLLERVSLFGEVKNPRRSGPLTARPRAGSAGGEPCYEPDLLTLIRYGDVSRRLALVEAVDPRARVALELYYGDQGAEWAADGAGRWSALYVLTRPGNALIEHIRLTATPEALELSDGERLRSEIRLNALQATEPTVPGRVSWRRALLEAAQRDAVALQLRADAAWRWASAETAPEDSGESEAA